MENIIDIINRIGIEVSNTLEKNDSKLYFQETVLLYSLAENLLKFLVATNDCWQETCKKVDEADEKEERGEKVDKSYCNVDFEKLRDKAKGLKLAQIIDRAFKENLIDDSLKREFDDFRKKRNGLIHQLYLFDNRNDKQIMKNNLIEAEAMVKKLLPIFEKLLFDEIGFTDSDLPEIFQPL